MISNTNLFVCVSVIPPRDRIILTVGDDSRMWVEFTPLQALELAEALAHTATTLKNHITPCPNERYLEMAQLPCVVLEDGNPMHLAVSGSDGKQHLFSMDPEKVSRYGDRVFIDVETSEQNQKDDTATVKLPEPDIDGNSEVKVKYSELRGTGVDRMAGLAKLREKAGNKAPKTAEELASATDKSGKHLPSVTGESVAPGTIRVPGAEAHSFDVPEGHSEATRPLIEQQASEGKEPEKADPAMGQTEKGKAPTIAGEGEAKLDKAPQAGSDSGSNPDLTRPTTGSTGASPAAATQGGGMKPAEAPKAPPQAGGAKQ